jgi:hypothetical protein
MNEIFWHKDYIPGLTDNFVSNEVMVAGLSALYHPWLIEDLPGGRVRILTQESQKGKPAQELAKKKPNVMINGHQDWLDGLVAAARKARSS